MKPLLWLKEGEPSRIELLSQLFERVVGVCLCALVCPWLLAERVRYFYVWWSTIWRNWHIDEGLRMVQPTKIFIHLFWVTSCRFYETLLCFWHRGSSCLVARISGCSGWFCLQILTAACVSGTACLPILRDSWRCTTTFKLRKKWHCICSYVLNTWGNKLLLLILLLYLRPPLLLFLVLISGAKTPGRVHTVLHRSGAQSVHRSTQACTGAQAPQKNLSWQGMGDFGFVQLFWCGTCWLNALCRSWA